MQPRFLFTTTSSPTALVPAHSIADYTSFSSYGCTFFETEVVVKDLTRLAFIPKFTSFALDSFTSLSTDAPFCWTGVPFTSEVSLSNLTPASPSPSPYPLFISTSSSSDVSSDIAINKMASYIDDGLSETDFEDRGDDDLDILTPGDHHLGLSKYYSPKWWPKDAFREYYQNW